jgi:hypothetical protein
MERSAVHAACVRTEIPLCELPAEGSQARVDFDARLFKTPLQLLDDFVDLFSFHSFPSLRTRRVGSVRICAVVDQEAGARPDTQVVGMEVREGHESRLQSTVQFFEVGRKDDPLP